MSLSDLAAIGSFVSGFAVLISLIFLYFQLRQIGQQVAQAEKNQQAAMRHGRANRIIDMNLRFAESDLAEIMQRFYAGREELSRAEYSRAESVWRAQVSSWEDTYYHRAEGSLNAAAYSSAVSAMKRTLSAPGARALWNANKPPIGTEFVAFIDKLVSETAAAERADTFELWKANLAAELSSLKSSN